jgi:hypothetical protein
MEFFTGCIDFKNEYSSVVLQLLMYCTIFSDVRLEVFYGGHYAEWCLRDVALVRTDVSEEFSASFIRVTIGD